MADVTKGNTAPEEPADGGLMRDVPTSKAIFEGNAKAMTVTKAVNTVQLAHEIDDRLGDPERYHVAMVLDRHDVPVSEKNPLTIYVHPADVDMRTVRGAVESHVADADYGRSEQDIEIGKLKERLAGGDLSLEELNRIVRSIVK